MLHDESGENAFKGFLIQARQLETNTIVGTFTEIPEDKYV
jgi:hypothetical protein